MEVPGILGRALPVVDKFHHSYRLLGVVSQFIGGYHGYPLVNVYSLLLKMAIEIVDLPINSMVIFHSAGTVYNVDFNGSF